MRWNAVTSYLHTGNDPATLLLAHVEADTIGVDHNEDFGRANDFQSLAGPRSPFGSFGH